MLYQTSTVEALYPTRDRTNDEHPHTNKLDPEAEGKSQQDNIRTPTGSRLAMGELNTMAFPAELAGMDHAP